MRKAHALYAKSHGRRPVGFFASTNRRHDLRLRRRHRLSPRWSARCRHHAGRGVPLDARKWPPLGREVTVAFIEQRRARRRAIELRAIRAEFAVSVAAAE